LGGRQGGDFGPRDRKAAAAATLRGLRAADSVSGGAGRGRGRGRRGRRARRSASSVSGSRGGRRARGPAPSSPLPPAGLRPAARRPPAGGGGGGGISAVWRCSVARQLGEGGVHLVGDSLVLLLLVDEIVWGSEPGAGRTEGRVTAGRAHSPAARHGVKAAEQHETRRGTEGPETGGLETDRDRQRQTETESSHREEKSRQTGRRRRTKSRRDVAVLGARGLVGGRARGGSGGGGGRPACQAV